MLFGIGTQGVEGFYIFCITPMYLHQHINKYCKLLLYQHLHITTSCIKCCRRTLVSGQ